MATGIGAATSKAKPLRLFISYAHEDEQLATRLSLLLAPLRHEQLVMPWHDRAISPGTRWEEEILRELDEADVVVLIVTPSYLNSIYSLQTELRRALERQKHDLVRIIPVIGRLCFWKKFSDLSSLQVLPRDGKPIEVDGKIRELLLVNAVEGIIKATEEIAALKLRASAHSSDSTSTLADGAAGETQATSRNRSADHNEISAPPGEKPARSARWAWIAFAALSVALMVTGGAVWRHRIASKAEAVDEPAAEFLETGKDLYKQKKYAAALPILREAEMRGSGEADDYLGLMYFSGKGVPRDYKAAEKWFGKADSRGNGNGTNHLGLLHESGSGVPLSYEKALESFRKAEALGKGDAMSNLGWMYFSGWGVSEDPNKAFEYFKKAADHRSGDGMNNLGWLYEQGIAVPKQDYQQAFTWFKKGADLQSSLAMNSIGWMLLNGLGRPKDQRKAIEWFQKAADCDDNLGSAMAMNNLGWIYENGFGVTPDKGKALSWYQKAAAMGNHLAKLSVHRLSGPACLNFPKSCGLPQT